MKHVQQHKTFFFIEGIVLVLLGLIAITWPTLSTLAIEKIVGWLFIIGGIAQIVRIIRSRGGFHPILSSFLALVYILLGFTFLLYPLSGAITLTLLLLMIFLIQGISQLIIGFKWSPNPFSAWMIFSGFFSILLGLLIFSGWPSNAAWVIGLLVGINLIVFGSFQIMLVMGSSPKTR